MESLGPICKLESGSSVSFYATKTFMQKKNITSYFHLEFSIDHFD